MRSSKLDQLQAKREEARALYAAIKTLEPHATVVAIKFEETPKERRLLLRNEFHEAARDDFVRWLAINRQTELRALGLDDRDLDIMQIHGMDGFQKA